MQIVFLGTLKFNYCPLLEHSPTCPSSLAQVVNQQVTSRITPDILRAPESILQGPWNEKVDIWTFGCLVRPTSVPVTKIQLARSKVPPLECSGELLRAPRILGSPWSTPVLFCALRALRSSLEHSRGGDLAPGKLDFRDACHPVLY